MPVLPKRVAPTPTSTYPLGPMHVTTLAEAMDEFKGRYGGEWRVRPYEQNAGASVDMGIGSRTAPYPTLGYLSATAGRWGNDLSDGVIFEYGSKRGNVASYTFNVDRQQIANRVFVPRVGFPEPGRTGTTAHIIVNAAVSQAAMAAQYDAWVDPGEIQLTAQRQALADFHLNIRSGSRRVVTFTPIVNAEIQPWIDYDVGDFVRFRALEDDTLRLDVTVRIYGITANIDNSGNESITLTTSEEATS